MYSAPIANEVPTETGKLKENILHINPAVYIAPAAQPTVTRVKQPVCILLIRTYETDL
jgi:hypothetical protein